MNLATLSIVRVRFENSIKDYFHELGNKIIPIPPKEELDKMSCDEMIISNLPDLGNSNVRVFRYIDNPNPAGYCVDFDSDVEKGFEFHFDGFASEELTTGLITRCEKAIQELNIDNKIISASLRTITTVDNSYELMLDGRVIR